MAASRVKKSTIVRTQILRSSLALGEHLAPGPASALVNLLWFRLPAGRRRAEAPAAAQVFTLDSAGAQVWGYEWGDGPLVYLTHGWGGCTGDFDTIAASLVAQGFRVVAFDAPSHGNSGDGPFGPRESSPLQIAGALRAVADKFGDGEAVIAHSLGCLAAVTALRESVAAKRVVMVSPFIGGELFTTRFAEQLRVGPRTFARFIARAEERIGKPMSYFSIPDPAMDIPALVLHDRRDRATPFLHGEMIADSWPQARLHATEGLGHMRILHNPTVVGEITRFVARH